MLKIVGVFSTSAVVVVLLVASAGSARAQGIHDHGSSAKKKAGERPYIFDPKNFVTTDDEISKRLQEIPDECLSRINSSKEIAIEHLLNRKLAAFADEVASFGENQGHDYSWYRITKYRLVFVDGQGKEVSNYTASCETGSKPSLRNSKPLFASEL